MNVMPLWVVMFSPSDMPNKFVARKHIVGLGNVVATQEVYTADTLEELRDLLPPGLTLMERHPSDDPVILETWL